MQDGQERVCDGVEMFGSDRGENREADALVCTVRIADVIRTAVDRYVMSPSNETGGQFFRERLEPAVIRRNAAGPKDRQFHRVRIIDYAFRTCRTSSSIAADSFLKR